MLTSKQRAQLRAMAAELNTELQIGKSGVTDNVVRQAEDALRAADYDAAYEALSADYPVKKGSGMRFVSAI